MTTEAALIEQAQSGDRHAFQRLLELHYDRIFRMAYSITGHKDDAYDIAQEVCLKLVDKLRSFRGDSSFTTWLYRITLNTARDMAKKRRTQRDLQHRYTEYDALDKAGDADSRSKVAALYRAIAQLSTDLRETALLILVQELSHAEAGAILGCAESTISWRMHELRKQLKPIMEADHG